MVAYFAEAYPQAFPDAVFTLPVLGIERTFWEKAAWANYETAVPGTLKLIPSAERLAAWESNYRAMQEMFFRHHRLGRRFWRH